jgi:hypothetical protein
MKKTVHKPNRNDLRSSFLPDLTKPHLPLLMLITEGNECDIYYI